MHSRNKTEIQWLIKYGLDFCMALVLVGPITVIILILGGIIYFDSPGPIFFSQLRPGRRGRLFYLFKLRTMTPGDHTNKTPRNPDGSLALSEEMQGYTHVGKWLRRFSLDELPQIYNILLGQMSFIGPRPDLPEHLTRYKPQEAVKLEMKPGMTGLAQVMGRNQLPWKERLRLDAEYIQKYSLWLDLIILWRTLGRLISGRGIYQGKE